MGYLVGTNIYSEKLTRNFTQGDDLGIKGFDNITNASTVVADNDIFTEKNVGLYFQLDFSYKKMLYLTVTGRQDYLSTLEDPFDFQLSDLALFYPSANLGFVFTELMNKDGFLNFGKFSVLKLILRIGKLEKFKIIKLISPNIALQMICW